MWHPLTWMNRLGEIVSHGRLLRIHLELGGVHIGSYIAALMLIQPRGWPTLNVHSLSGLRALLIPHVVWILLLKMRNWSKVILRNVVAALYALRWRGHHLP
jgi:hypothetical protein